MVSDDDPFPTIPGMLGFPTLLPRGSRDFGPMENKEELILWCLWGGQQRHAVYIGVSQLCSCIPEPIPSIVRQKEVVLQ